MGDKPKTHCFNGHELTPENIRSNCYAFRQCRTCYNATNRRRRAGILAALKEIVDYPVPALCQREDLINIIRVLKDTARNALPGKGGTPKGRRWPKAALMEAAANLTQRQIR